MKSSPTSCAMRASRSCLPAAAGSANCVAAVVRERERDVEARQREPRRRSAARAGTRSPRRAGTCGAPALLKNRSRTSTVVPCRMRRRAPPAPLRPSTDSISAPARRRARAKRAQARHRGDGRQRLAAKAERARRARGRRARRSCSSRGARARAAARRPGCRRRRRARGSAGCRRARCRSSTCCAPGVERVLDQLLDTDAGRSMTSPAAIWSTSGPSRIRMGMALSGVEIAAPV